MEHTIKQTRKTNLLRKDGRSGGWSDCWLSRLPVWYCCLLAVAELCIELSCIVASLPLTCIRGTCGVARAVSAATKWVGRSETCEIISAR